MVPQILGIHHVTAIAGDPQANIDFYAGFLGLRLVKLTVNFDDPTTYHLYYGDGQGHPGTILTFFPWPGAARGRIGTGQLTVTSFAVPEHSLDFWQKRSAEYSVPSKRSRSLLDEATLTFEDPDGLQLELVSTANANPDRTWEQGPVPVEFGIRGFHHVTLSEEGYERTASLLTETLGFTLVSSNQNQFRYAVASGDPGCIVDVLCTPAGRAGRVSVGTVHHVAWRTPDHEQQTLWQKALRSFNVTPIMDRKYFQSIYFREPGGVLFEIATDPPGFTVDEPLSELGSHLLLPPRLEPARAQLEGILPRLSLPAIKHQG